MTACNARPPADHPLARSLVACHLADDHLALGQPHSWDIEAAVERHEVLVGALDALRARFPDRKIERFDSQLVTPLAVYDVDEHGERASQPYRVWDLPAGPWVVVTFAGGEQCAVWKATGDVYRVGADGAVDEHPILGPHAESESPLKPPPPGSPEAGKLGCRCPVIDNAYGAGRGEVEIRGKLKTVYALNEACPLHGAAVNYDWRADE